MTSSAPTSHAERCTAAIALGYELGHRSVETSLDELRIIGTPQELDDRSSPDEATLDQHSDLILVAGLSIARLFATGARTRFSPGCPTGSNAESTRSAVGARNARVSTCWPCGPFSQWQS
jgi:hypothetical protein